jgi:copper(I)-binding protein
VTLFDSRSSALALAGCGLAATLALAGCSAGQISQSANQQPAVNGTLTWVGDPTNGIALRNVHLRAPQTADYVRPGSEAELLLVAINESAAEADRLVSVTSSVGTVTLTGDMRVPPGGTLVVGTPDGVPSPLDATEGADTAQATVQLTQPISNGLNYPFTFTFERSGQKEVAVPISAGEAPRREAAVEAGAEADTGGH